MLWKNEEELEEQVRSIRMRKEKKKAEVEERGRCRRTRSSRWHPGRRGKKENVM